MISEIGGFGPQNAFGATRERPTFDALDTDGDGAVSVAELQSASGAESGRVEAFVDALDADANGALSQDELRAFREQVEAKVQELKGQLAGGGFLSSRLDSASLFDALTATGDEAETER